MIIITRLRIFAPPYLARRSLADAHGRAALTARGAGTDLPKGAKAEEVPGLRSFPHPPN